MNRSIWTWIQLAASVSNAAFLVVSHMPNGSAAADIANVLAGQATHRFVVQIARVVPSHRDLEARL